MLISTGTQRYSRYPISIVSIGKLAERALATSRTDLDLWFQVVWRVVVADNALLKGWTLYLEAYDPKLNGYASIFLYAVDLLNPP